MSSTITPNMGLIEPTVGNEPSPTWANDLNADISILDGHDHSSGRGVAITCNGISINADLPFNANNATSLRAARFSAQVSPISNSGSDVGEIYVSGNELYYNDVTGGNQVQITSNGSVNAGAGSITGLPSGTASASFSSSTFTFQSATSTAANLDGRSLILRNSSASSKGLTLNPPTSMAANIIQTLPSIPAAQSFMAIDTSGNMSGYANVSAGITAAMIANATITTTQIAASTIVGGNIASNINLAGDAVQEDGKNVVVANTNATKSLAIIRGTVSAAGDLVDGEGFSCVRSSTGTFTLTWTTAFGDNPTVVGTSNKVSNAGILTISSWSTTGAVIKTWNVNSALENDAFLFTAIGQRA